MIGRLSAIASSLVVLGGVALAGPAWSQAAGSTVTVRTAYANLRAEATTHSEKVGKVMQGAKLEVVGTSGDWVQVKSGDKTAYVNRKLVVIPK
jgi:uncharacterized protein YgiM (DUF1202 family)